MPIEEGDKYRLGKITFKNNKAVPNVNALRSLFPLKDGDIFARDKVAKGLENLRKAYGQLRYINFTSVPGTTFDDEKKLAFLEIDVDEGSRFYCRPISFPGTTTTLAKASTPNWPLEEANIHNTPLWKLTLPPSPHFTDTVPSTPH